jgi:transcriptional regulator with XRE-family HTH domain
MVTFGEFLKARRQMCELTLEELAQKIGSHKGYLSGIETGAVAPPSPKVIKLLAEALKTDATTLLLMGYAEKAPKEIKAFVKSKLL